LNPLAARLDVRRLALAIGGTILALDILVGLGAWYTLDSSRRSYDTQAAELAANSAMALDQDLSSYVRQIELSSSYIVDQLEAQLRRQGRISEAEANAFLKLQNDRLGTDIVIRSSDARGEVFLGKDVPHDHRSSWHDRDFFRTLSTQPDKSLHVAGPMLGRVSKVWLIAFVRRYEMPDGSFAGVVSITLSLESLGKMLATRELGPHGAVELRNEKGHMVASYPPPVLPPAEAAPKPDGSQSVVDSQADPAPDPQPMSQVYRSASQDGASGINAYQRMVAVPYHITVRVSSLDYLQNWRHEVMASVMVVVAYVLATAALGWLLWKSLLLAKRQTEQTRILLRGASDGICILDRQGVILEASESFCQSVGYNHDEIIGVSIQSLDAAMTPAEVAQAIDRVFSTDQIVQFESVHRHKDGSLIPVEISAKSLVMDSRPVIFTSSRNIAERQRAARDLTERESRFRQLIEKNQSVMLEIDPESGRLLAANESAVQYYGYPRAELLQMNIAQINLATTQELAAELQRAAKEERGYFNFKHRLASGEVREVEVYSTPVEILGRKHLFSIVHDISVRRQAESRVMELVSEQRAILNSEIVGICKVKNRQMIWVNEAFAKMFGYSIDELTDQPTDILYPDLQRSKAFAEAAYPAIDLKGIYKTQVQYKRKDGSTGWYDVTGAMVNNESGESVWAMMDITGIVRAESNQRRAARVFANSYDGIVVTDSNNLIVDVNPAYTRITGYTLDEVIGKNPNFISSGRQNEIFYHDIWESLKKTDAWQGEVWNRRKSGEIFAEMLSISVVRDQHGSLLNYIGVFSDISNLKQHEQELDRIAHFDALTGLPNRRLFQDQLQRELQMALRTGCNVALLVIDLDRFKEVNDTLGHDAGDRLLVEAAQRLRTCVRESDMVARLGGDEFVVVMPVLKGQTAVTRVAQSIIDTMQNAFWLEKQEAFISASIGVAVFPEDASDASTLFKHADQAMYEAKGLGRSRFEYFRKSMQSLAEARISLARALRHAIEQSQFELRYQPIVDLNSGEIVKCEALIRWNHPERGLLGPAEFITVAEDVGLIGQIGDWVFRQATKDIAELNVARSQFGGLKPMQVSINASPRQFHYGLDQIAWLAHLRDIGLAPGLVVIEITEGLLLDNRPEVARQLFAFRDVGIQVAIDDFGTGYSALSYLTKFHIDYLKIDQSFVRGISVNLDDRAIVEAIVSMAHKLNIEVIAEGIEIVRQYEILASIACNYGQGYYIDKPLTIADLRDRVLK